MYRAAVECLKKHRQENENFTQFIEVQAKSSMNTIICIQYKQEDGMRGYEGISYFSADISSYLMNATKAII